MLNQSQNQAVGAPDRFLMLLAGAGTGKTRVIIERIKRLIGEGTDPEAILALTFTRKAAHEMKKRIGDERISALTFHGFCYEMVADENRDIVLYDGTDQAFSPEERLQVTRYKNSLMAKRKPKILKQYEEHLKSINAIDYDDLLHQALVILKEDKQESHIRYLLIDEFQDTNMLQYAIMTHLIKAGTSVFAVGDPDQSIYRFRGANHHIITRYVRDYHATVMRLEMNYRSQSHIIRCANNLIGFNKDRIKKTLHTEKNDEKRTVSHILFESMETEADAIIKLVRTLIGNRIPPGEIAVLFRNHERAYILEAALIQAEMAYDSEDDDNETSGYGIRLMTIHRAKGLEFDAVIILGLEAGILPSDRENRISETEEERRLMFVGVTRARRELFLTSVLVNDLFRAQKTSRFVFECGVKTMNYHGKDGIMTMGDFDGRQRTD